MNAPTTQSERRLALNVTKAGLVGLLGVAAVAAVVVFHASSSHAKSHAGWVSTDLQLAGGTLSPTSVAPRITMERAIHEASAPGEKDVRAYYGEFTSASYSTRYGNTATDGKHAVNDAWVVWLPHACVPIIGGAPDTPKMQCSGWYVVIDAMTGKRLESFTP